ncbi:MAG: hypothetical protein ACD_57C00062G0002, partial [uncultured bacterium]
MTPPHFLTIKEAKAGLSQKKFSTVELIRSCLEQIRKYDKQVKAFLYVADEKALIRQAQKVDEKIARQEQLGNLEGIPVALKDLFSSEGMPTTAGAKIISDYVPVYDSTVVKRLKEAGAIIIGKTNEDAWGHGSSGENSDFPPTRNPWDLER